MAAKICRPGERILSKLYYNFQERAAVNVILAMVNGDSLDRLSATDEDGLHAGVVNFEVVGNGMMIICVHIFRKNCFTYR